MFDLQWLQSHFFSYLQRVSVLDTGHKRLMELELGAGAIGDLSYRIASFGY